MKLQLRKRVRYLDRIRCAVNCIRAAYHHWMDDDLVLIIICQISVAYITEGAASNLVLLAFLIKQIGQPKLFRW